MKARQLIELIDKIHNNKPNQAHKDALMAALIEGNVATLNKAVTIEGLGLVTPLMYAAYLGDEDAVALLLRFTRVINIQENTRLRYTALDWAYVNPQPNENCIRMLLKAGAKTNEELASSAATLQSDTAAIQEFMLNEQNTHDPMLTESVHKAIQALGVQYPQADPEAILAEIKNKITTALQQEPETQKALNNFLVHPFMNFKYPGSEYSLKQMLCLVWVASHDPQIFKDGGADNDARELSLFMRMIDAQRGAYGACAEGRCHALIETLDRIHPEVNLCYGNAAIQDILFMRFKQLFKEKLQQQPNSKAITLAAQFLSDEPEAKAYLDYYNEVKDAIVRQMRAEFPVAFEKGRIATGEEGYDGKPISVAPTEWFTKYLKLDDVPLETPDYTAIKDLQKFHLWLCNLSTPTTTAQQALSALIEEKLSASNTQTLADCYAEILQAAEKTYAPHSAWLKWINCDAELKYFSNLKFIIKQFPQGHRAFIAKYIQDLDSAEEADLRPIWGYVIKYLMELSNPETGATIIDFLPESLDAKIELLKQVLSKTAALEQTGIDLRINPEFVRQCKINKLINRVAAKLNNSSWLNAEELQALEIELQDKNEAEQNDTIDYIYNFYKCLHFPKQAQTQAQQEFIQLLIAKPQHLQKSPFLQNLLLNNRNSEGNSFMHFIASSNNPQLFALLSDIYANNDNYRVKLGQALRAVDHRGNVPMRLACKHQNKAFLDFAYKLRIGHAPNDSDLNSLITLLTKVIKTLNCLSPQGRKNDLKYPVNGDILNDVVSCFITSLISIIKYEDTSSALYLLDYLQQLLLEHYKSPLLSNLGPLLLILHLSDHNLEILNWFLEKNTDAKEYLRIGNFDDNFLNGDIQAVMLMLQLDIVDPKVYGLIVRNAAKIDSSKIISLILDKSKNSFEILTASDNLGMNALLYAAALGNNKCASTILKACPAANMDELLNIKITADKHVFHKFTALQLAAAEGHLDIIDLLLNACSSPEAKTKLITNEIERQQTAIHCAAEHGHSACLQRLLEFVTKDELNTILNKANKYSNQILHLAAATGDATSILAILAKFDTDEEKQACLQRLNIEGLTPLHCLAKTGNVAELKRVLAIFPKQIAAELLNAARDKAIKCTDDLIFPTLFAAVEPEQQQDYLYKHNLQDVEAIHEAIRLGKLQTITLLLNTYTNPTEKQQLLDSIDSYSQRTLLHNAASSRDLATFKFVLQQYPQPQDPQLFNKLDRYSNTILHQAIDSHNLEIVNFILEQIKPENVLKDYLRMTNKQNESALSKAIHGSSPAIINRLLEFYTAPEDEEYVWAAVNEPYFSMKPIYWALFKIDPDPELVQAIVDACPKKYLQRFLTQTSATCDNGTPLHMAAGFGSNPENVKILVSACEENKRLNYLTQKDAKGKAAFELIKLPRTKFALLPFYPTDAIFANPQLLEKNHFNAWLDAKYNWAIEELLSKTGIVLKKDAYGHMNLDLLKNYKPTNPIQIQTRELLLEFHKKQKTRKHAIFQETKIIMAKTLVDMLELIEKPADASIQQKCIANAAKLQRRSLGEKATIAVYALVCIALTIAAAITFVPTGGLSIGLLVGAGICLYSAGITTALTPVYKHLGKRTNKLIDAVAPDARRKPTTH